MKAIAIQGTSRVLVHTSGELQSADAMGNVVDLFTTEVYPEGPVQAILARGYWEDIEDGAKATEAVARVSALRSSS